MPLRECMQKTSHRDYKTWMLYLEESWNTHSKDDYYFAQIALEVRRVLSKKPGEIHIKDFLLDFGTPEEKVTEDPEVEQSRLEQLSAWAKSAMAARFDWNKDQRKDAEMKGRKNA